MFKDFIKLLLLSVISIIFSVLLYKFLCGEEIIPKKENRYYLVVDNAWGIRYNTKIYLKGFKIGKITKMEFDYNAMKTNISIAIDKKIKLKKDSFITITSDLLGNKSMIVNIGNGEDLENNSCIECKENTFSLSQALNDIQQIITRINELQKSINIEEIKNNLLNIISTEGNDGKSFFMDFIANINDILKNISTLIGEIKKTNPTETIANINDILKNISTLIGEIKKTNPAETIVNINDILKNISTLIEDIKKTNPVETIETINDLLKDFKENVIQWIKEIKKKNNGKGFMSFSF